MNSQSDRDLTGAYSLNALTPEQRREFEEYLEVDDDARAEATELGDTAVYLGLAVPAAAPPPELKDQLMGMLDATPQLPAVEREPLAHVTPIHREGIAPRSTAAPGRVYRLTKRTGVLLAAAAAVLAAIVVGGIALRPTVAPDATAQAISQIRNASDVRTARDTVDGGGTAEVLWSASQGKAAVTVDDLPALSASRVYELWFIDHAGIPSRAGTFTSDGTTKSVLLAGTMSKGGSVALTVEPKGGSNAPTTEPVLVVDTA